MPIRVVPIFDSVADLVESGVDAITVCTPAATHTAVTDDVIQRGIPVVCDKPFALNADAARHTVELAERAGVLVTAYQNRRGTRICSPCAGCSMPASWVRSAASSPPSSGGQLDPTPPAAGGGLLRDFGSHLVDQALYLFGPVHRVYAETHELEPELEDDFQLMLAHDGGMRSRLSGAWRQGAPAPRIRVTGSEGSFVISAPIDGQEQALIAGRTPAGEGVDWGREPDTAWGSLCRGERAASHPERTGPVGPVLRAVRPCGARRRSRLPVDPWDAVATATVLDAARRSAAEGRSVDVPTVSR